MKKNNEGFSLVEVLLSMVLLAAIVIPTCTSLVLSFRVNAKAEALTQAQLAVSSAVETLMAEGIDGDRAKNAITGDGVYDSIPVTSVSDEANEETQASQSTTDASAENNWFSDVGIWILDDSEQSDGYHVKITDNAGLVTVTTYIRIAKEVANE